MMRPARVWATIALVLGLGIWTLSSSKAADIKAAGVAVQKIAGLLEKGDQAGAEKQAKATAEEFEELDKIMHMFKPRKRKGLGVGTKSEMIEPDGIELKLLELLKNPLNAEQLAKEAKALTKMGYHAAAIAEVALLKAPEKDDGKKKVKDWVQWAKDLKKASLDLAKAAKKKDEEGVAKAVSKMNASCSNCHVPFRKSN